LVADIDQRPPRFGDGVGDAGAAHAFQEVHQPYTPKSGTGTNGVHAVQRKLPFITVAYQERLLAELNAQKSITETKSSA
jgi:hypothetical protein